MKHSFYTDSMGTILLVRNRAKVKAILVHPHKRGNMTQFMKYIYP